MLGSSWGSLDTLRSGGTKGREWERGRATSQGCRIKSLCLCSLWNKAHCYSPREGEALGSRALWLSVCPGLEGENPSGRRGGLMSQGRPAQHVRAMVTQRH